MTGHISEEATEAVARAIHDAAYENESEEKRQRLWTEPQYSEARKHRLREAHAAILAYEAWRTKNRE